MADPFSHTRKATRTPRATTFCRCGVRLLAPTSSPGTHSSAGFLRETACFSYFSLASRPFDISPFERPLLFSTRTTATNKAAGRPREEGARGQRARANEPVPPIIVITKPICLTSSGACFHCTLARGTASFRTVSRRRLAGVSLVRAVAAGLCALRKAAASDGFQTSTRRQKLCIGNPPLRPPVLAVPCTSGSERCHGLSRSATGVAQHAASPTATTGRRLSRALAP